ncbi:TetR/AcrR family transcriptional regulator [Microbispora bryophytorum]|uniref:TetR/AcrR family transcriptional regulator n=1 Tax=Microbispora bryophytorum TaxID=1460882 RepID=UPI003720F973
MPTPSQTHRLRADAVRNRQALLAAAREAFAEHGMEVSISEIAQRAGIGKGTVFRHFATKESLAAAIVADRLDELAATGRTLLEDADPEAALLEFMTAGVALHVSDRSFCQAATTDVRGDPVVRAAADRLTGVAEALTGRASREGAIRGDITGEDVIRMLTAACQAAAPERDVTGAWRRYLHLIFDGLRSEGARPLPPLSPLPPPAWQAPLDPDTV